MIRYLVCAGVCGEGLAYKVPALHVILVYLCCVGTMPAAAALAFHHQSRRNSGTQLNAIGGASEREVRPPCQCRLCLGSLRPLRFNFAFMLPPDSLTPDVYATWPKGATAYALLCRVADVAADGGGVPMKRSSARCRK
jgi:hypothetical protein